MRFSQTLDTALAEGLSIEVEDGNLRVTGPKEVIAKYTPFLREHKGAVLNYLGPNPLFPPEVLQEYDALIHRLCNLRNHSPEYRERLLQARRSMAPAKLMDDLEQFREIVRAAENEGKR